MKKNLVAALAFTFVVFIAKGEIMLTPVRFDFQYKKSTYNVQFFVFEDSVDRQFVDYSAILIADAKLSGESSFALDGAFKVTTLRWKDVSLSLPNGFTVLLDPAAGGYLILNTMRPGAPPYDRTEITKYFLGLLAAREARQSAGAKEEASHKKSPSS